MTAEEIKLEADKKAKKLARKAEKKAKRGKVTELMLKLVEFATSKAGETIRPLVTELSSLVNKPAKIKGASLEGLTSHETAFTKVTFIAEAAAIAGVPADLVKTLAEVTARKELDAKEVKLAKIAKYIGADGVKMIYEKWIMANYAAIVALKNKK